MLRVTSENVSYSTESILSYYSYNRSVVNRNGGDLEVVPRSQKILFRTARRVPKTGLMLVGLGGNNGSTVVAGLLANKKKLSWTTKEGVFKADFLGSITQSATMKIGDCGSEQIFAPLHRVLPMLRPEDIVVGGWDINKDDLAKAMAKAKVMDIGVQKQLKTEMAKISPLPSIYYPDFIASNQAERANNCLSGRKACLEHLNAIRRDIRDFKEKNRLEKVIILWTANTERFCKVTEGVHDTEENFMKAVKDGNSEISPSQIFAMASILENCAYINGSPQNTLVPAITSAAQSRRVFLAGDDFKSGQTKIKSVLVDFLISAGIRLESLVSYNHLGNNDGKNLSSPQQFTSKEISKSNVVDDMIASNAVLYEKKRKPDHVVVIKYVPFVGDSKRAMDEYTSSIFMGGRNTIVLHNTCEDSLLAAPIIVDLAVLTELFQRIQYCVVDEDFFEIDTKINTKINTKISSKIKQKIEQKNEQKTNIKNGGEKLKQNGHCLKRKNISKSWHLNYGEKENVEKKIAEGIEDKTNSKRFKKFCDGEKILNDDKNILNDDKKLILNGEKILTDDKKINKIAELEKMAEKKKKFKGMNSVLSVLSYLMKSPQVPKGEPVVNALFRQRAGLENIMRACAGLQPDNGMLLEHKCEGILEK